MAKEILRQFVFFVRPSRVPATALGSQLNQLLADLWMGPHVTILSHTTATLVGAGGFADVLRFDGASVAKLFRRMRVTEDPVEAEADHSTVVRAVWDAEAAAYEIASRSPGLAAHLAPYLGRLEVADVIDGSGNTLAGNYLLDCAYRLGLIPGKDTKIAMLMGTAQFDAIDSYLEELVTAGVTHTHDSSVFTPGCANGFTVIDIATWDAMAELSTTLSATGRLPDHVRAR